MLATRPGKRAGRAGTCLVVAGLVAACGGAAQSPGTSGGTSGTAASGPAAGGDLVLVQAKGTKTLDPVAAVSPEDIAPMYELYDTLYRLSDDGRTLEPSLATAAPVASAGGTVWTIGLRTDATFSDGTPVTAADVAFSLDRARTSQGAFSFLLGGIDSVKASDEHTVVITTPEPSATLVPALGSWVASVLPKGLAGKTDDAFFTAPVGSGPFVLGTWERGRSLRLTKNPRYWQPGRPLLDAIQWNTVPDANTRVSQVQGGQADVASDVPFSQVASLKAGSAVTAGTFPATYTTMLIFNQRHAPFADVHVRRAIARALDREAITKSTLYGAGRPACSLLPPAMPFAATPACPSFDVAAAKAELAQSAFPQGFPVELTIDNLPESSTTAQIIQAELAAIGITVKIKVVDSGELYTVYGQQAYQMGLAAWASDIPDPDEQLSFMLDPQAGGNSYYTGYTDARVTELVSRARSSLDPAARTAAYAQVQDIVVQDVPQLPLSYRDNAYVWRRSVQQFSVNPMGVIDFAAVGVQE